MFAGESIDFCDFIQVVAPELHLECCVGVGGEDGYDVSQYFKGSPTKVGFYPLVLNVDQIFEEIFSGIAFAYFEFDGESFVGFYVSQTINTRDRGDDNYVFSSQKIDGCGVSEFGDFFVDGGLFFDEGIGFGHIGFWLVVVVVAHKISHGIIGEELLKLCTELGS